MSRANFLVLWAGTSLLVVAFLTLSVSGRVVTDTDDNPVKFDQPYYALSNINGTEQGRSGLSYTNGSTQTVLQEPSSAMGIPVIFSPQLSEDEDGDILTIDILTIDFYPKGLTTTWQLGEVDNATGNRYVTLGGDDKREDEDNYSFRIRRRKKLMAYNIVSITKNGSFHYGNIGISSNNESRKWLSIQNDSLNIQFQKV